MSQDFAIEIAVFCQQQLINPTKRVGDHQAENFDDSAFDSRS